ncbi:MAG TPA: hypothetical protein VHP32_08060 [Ignavibacteria bacterium]|nr:hypothetical protein [Ignavibacteria bacterium]
MPKTKKPILKHPVILLLKSFSEEEILGLKEFLHSVYYNTNKKIVFLYESLIFFYPEFNDRNLTHEYLWDSINTKKNISYDELRVYLSKLQTLTLEFLKVNYFAKNNFEGELGLLKELSERHQVELFQKKINKTKSWPELELEGNDCYRKKYLISTEKLNFLTNNFQILKNKEIKYGIEAINEVSVNLCNFYITDLICEFIQSYNFLKNYQNDYSDSLVNDLIKSLNLDNLMNIYAKHSKDYFILLVYKKLLELINDDDIKRYYDYKKIVEENFDKMSKDELYFHFSNMISYCIHEKFKASNQNQSKFQIELFELYEKYLTHKMFIISETIYIDFNIFRNILMNALTLKKLSWAENFVDTYVNYLNPKYQVNLLNYSKAIISNRRANYDESLNYASKVDIDNFIFKHDLNFLKLKNYYSTGDFDGIIHLIHSHRELLRVDKLLTKDFYIKYNKFLFYAEKLILNHDSKKKLEFNLHKLQTENVSYANWLIEKYTKRLKELKK